ncbi:MAG: AAA family ATPase, partial [bacterium]
GEMRRVAIAGVLAMSPQVLVLDEPAAGLDPQGKVEILNRIRDLHTSRHLTVILITHSMDDAAQLTRRLIVLNKGRLAMDGSVREVFARAEELRGMGLGVPAITELVQRLRRRGLSVRVDAVTQDEAQRTIKEALAWN